MGRKRRNWQQHDGFGGDSGDDFDLGDDLDDIDDEYDDFEEPSTRVAGAADPDLKVVRLDTWLWAAHMFKSQAFASEACSENQVKVNDVYGKATKMISVGDVVVALTARGRRQYEVVGLAGTRGPTTASATLFKDTTPAEWNQKPKGGGDHDSGSAQGKKGRKRDRRAARKLKYR